MNYNKVVYIVLFISFLLLYGCKDDDHILSGTRWKLEAFVNDSTGNKSTPQGEGRMYTLFFDSSKKFSGYSSVNEFYGNYKLNEEMGTISFSDFWTTKVGEPGDGEKYYDSLQKVYSFLLSQDKLRLIYDKEKCLLFYAID